MTVTPSEQYRPFEEPKLIHRVLEELPDGRIRYESNDGEQTGLRVGLCVVRDGVSVLFLPECGKCNKILKPERWVVVDLLTFDRYIIMQGRDAALLVADEVSRLGLTPVVFEWLLDQTCREHRGLALQSFREWRSKLRGQRKREVAKLETCT